MSLVAVVAALERRAAEAEREGATAPVANVYRLILEDLRPPVPDGKRDHPAATRSLQKMMIEQAASTGRERVNALTSGTKLLERLHQVTDTIGSPR